MRDYIEEAHAAHEMFNTAISQIANDRMGFAQLELQGHLKGPLKVIFGMGSEAITYCGYLCHYELGEDGRTMEIVWDHSDHPVDAWSDDGEELIHPSELQPLTNALDDVINITDGYRNGCPDDIEVRYE